MNNWTLLQMLGVIPGQREIFEDICRKLYELNIPVLGPRGNTTVMMESTFLWIPRLRWIGTRSVRNPSVHVHYSEPGIATPAESSLWKRLPAPLGLTSWNPRMLETSKTIRPGESIGILPILFPLARVREIGIYCKLLMDDESPVQSGVLIGIDEVPQDGRKEKLGEENFFPVLHPCSTDPDPNQRLSPAAKDVLNRIITSQGSIEGRGFILIRGFPSNNEATYCVFSLTGGNTLAFRRADLEWVLEELIQAGFIMELDRKSTQIRYKLVE